MQFSKVVLPQPLGPRSPYLENACIQSTIVSVANTRKHQLNVSKTDIFELVKKLNKLIETKTTDDGVCYKNQIKPFQNHQCT